MKGKIITFGAHSHCWRRNDRQ